MKQGVYTIYEYLNRNDILGEGVVDCVRRLYDDSYPKLNDDHNYDAIIDEVNRLTGDEPRRTPYTYTTDDGEQYMYPHDFFYCPMSYQINVLNNYVEAYAVDRKWETYVDTVIDYLENEDGTACTETYETDENGTSRRTYKNVPKLRDAIVDVLKRHGVDDTSLTDDVIDKIFEHIDLCKKFYKFGLPEENYFRGGIVFRSPNSNRATVTEAWKKVFNEDVVIPDDDTWVDEFEELEDVDDGVDLEIDDYFKEK